MARVLSGLITRYSPGRMAIYQLLLATPDARWTVEELTALLPTGSVSGDAVRATLYVLEADDVMKTVPAVGSVLTMAFTAHGADQLRSIVRGWSGALTRSVRPTL